VAPRLQNRLPVDDPDQPEGAGFAAFWQNYQELVRSYLWRRSGLVIILLDLDKIILAGNAGFSRLLGEPEIWRGQPLALFLEPACVDALKAFPAAGGEVQVRLTFLLGAAKGLILTCQVMHYGSGYIIFGEKPLPSQNEVILQLSQLTSELTDISRELAQKNRELAKANAAITQLLRTDALTGLANRRFLMEALAPTLAAAQRHRLPLSLIMVDLDHFKAINDTWGHDVGDAVLQGFGQILQQETRQEDLTARYGGEEFVILLPYTDREGARRLAARIQEKLAAKEFPGLDRPVTASFGIAQLAAGDDAAALLKRADQALYLAKARGRDRVETA
jgi:diguanylate cyclase (GGDEF)-like protein